MKRLIRTALALAATTMIAGTAFAAINPDAVHLALDSLLVASSKMSVRNAIRKNRGKPPADNAAANLGAPNTMTTTEISSIIVRNGVVNVYLAPVTGTDHGLVQFVPRIVQGPKGGNTVEFACSSPNIPDIAKIESSCSYRPATR
ncbi:MAG TPA: hypothetical protein VJ727_08065 [Rhodanobacteraceae bacterium]|nr:hypothetical protein [Rhodanobacteraceae bacterium]